MTLQVVKTVREGNPPDIHAIQTNYRKEQKEVDFIRFKDELSILNGLTLRQHRVVIPIFLHKKTIAVVHQAHQRILKDKCYICVCVYMNCDVRIVFLYLE